MLQPKQPEQPKAYEDMRLTCDDCRRDHAHAQQLQ